MKPLEPPAGFYDDKPRVQRPKLPTYDDLPPEARPVPRKVPPGVAKGAGLEVLTARPTFPTKRLPADEDADGPGTYDGDPMP